MKFDKKALAGLTTACLAAISTGASSAASDNFSAPDFAFPRKVEAAAKTELSQAEDSRAMLRALINLSLADVAISRENLPEVTKRIATLRATEKDPSVAALLDILLAGIFNEVYSTDRSTYDERPLTLQAPGENWKEWSGSQMKAHIMQLTERALAASASLSGQSVESMRGVINYDTNEVEVFKPTLLDFTALKAFDILNGLAVSDAAARLRRDALVQSMLAADASNPAESVLWELRKIRTLPYDNSNFNRLQTLFDAYVNKTAAAVEIVNAMSPWVDSPERRKQQFADAQKLIALYPSYYRISAMTDVIAGLSAKRVNISSSTSVYPGTPLQVIAKVTNVDSYTVNLWQLSKDLPVSTQYTSKKIMAGAKKVQSFSRSASGSVPFTVTDTLSIEINDPGMYAVDVTFNGANDNYDHQSSRVITCSKLSAFSTSLERNDAYAVDASTGKPLKGVKFYNYARPADKWVTTPLGSTNADGSISLSESVPSYIYAVSGKDKSLPLNLYAGLKIGKFPVTTYESTVFSSLSVYHPGDKVECGAVFYKNVGLARSLAQGMRVLATLNGADIQKIAEKTLTTDEWGRVTTEFDIPTDLLPGRYSINFILQSAKDNELLTSNIEFFEVADYKMPTYQVILSKVRQGADGSYVVTGKLQTYTGVAMRNCEAILNLKSAPLYRWWGGGTPQSFYTAKLKSNDEGAFEFVIPASTFAAAPNPRGFFTAEVMAVSQNGESQSASENFAVGKLCLLQATLPEFAEKSQKLTPQIKLTDVEGKPLVAQVNYEVMIAGDSQDAKDKVRPVIARGSFNSASPAIDLSNIVPGRYVIKFSVPSMPDSEPFEAGVITIYSNVVGAPSPVSLPVWSTEERIITDAAGKCVITYATPPGESYVLLNLYNPADGHSIERRWLKSNGGVAKVEVALPADMKQAEAALTAVRKFDTRTSEITIKRPEANKQIRLVTSSLRDLSTPNATEKWTFKLEYTDGTPVEGAVVMDMYAKALEKISDENSLKFYTSYGPLLTLSVLTADDATLSTGAYSTVKHVQVAELQMPKWEMWGRSIGGLQNYFTRGYGKLMMSAAPPMANGMLDAGGEAKKESAVEDLSMQDENKKSSFVMPAIDYRPAEVPLALFKPNLVTNANGELSIEVTLPNAVTTWQLNAMAYTRDLLTTDLSRTIVTSKPVMIQPNAPRFLRAGDKADLLSTVFNKSDEALTVRVMAEAIDMNSGKKVATGETSVSVAPGGSQTVSVPVDVKLPGGSLMQLKMSAISGSFTDGEIVAVPVLSSAASVIESQPFYINTEAESAEIQLKSVPADAITTLQYCDNPFWLCVLALPTLAESNATTATEAASNLVMSVTAREIVKSYPAVRDAITQWAEGDKSDATLVSMLERNPELKQLMLSATPWMSEAKSDSERMSRLALLLNGDNTDKAIAEATKKLLELQNEDGAWRWSPQSSVSSEWVTNRVLQLIGSLSQLGWMPDTPQFTAMVKKAVDYIDVKAAERYSRNPGSSFIEFTLLRDMFSYTESPGAHKATLSAVREARTAWRNMSPVNKARVAILLDNHGYGDIAREALASISEYALKSPEKGMWWDGVDLLGATQILHTYFTLKATGKEIDAIRQWIIYQKETTDWGNTPDASLIVASLLSTSTKWVAPAKGEVTVAIDGKNIPVKRGDYGSGFFSMNLPDGASGRLTVAHSAGTAAWGAVVSHYEQPATEVAAYKIPDLSIEKAILVADPGAKGEMWNEGASIKLGDKVKVRLTLKVARDLDYVTIVDNRASCFEPTDQLPANVFSQKLAFYRVNGDADTRLFIDHLPKGTYVLTYDVSANLAGSFVSGVATVQSFMTPSMTAHSAGQEIRVSR